MCVYIQFYTYSRFVIRQIANSMIFMAFFSHNRHEKIFFEILTSVIQESFKTYMLSYISLVAHEKTKVVTIANCTTPLRNKAKRFLSYRCPEFHIPMV